MNNGPEQLIAPGFGLFTLLFGIKFLREDILDIKKGHIAIAILFKIEERYDDDSATLMTLGFFILILSGSIYWKASPQTCGFLLPVKMIAFVSIFYIRAQKFIKKLRVT